MFFPQTPSLATGIVQASTILPRRLVEVFGRNRSTEDEASLSGSLGKNRFSANGRKSIGLAPEPDNAKLASPDWTRCRIAVQASYPCERFYSVSKVKGLTGSLTVVVLKYGTVGFR